MCVFPVFSREVWKSAEKRESSNHRENAESELALPGKPTVQRPSELPGSAADRSQCSQADMAAHTGQGPNDARECDATECFRRLPSTDGEDFGAHTKSFTIYVYYVTLKAIHSVYGARLIAFV